MLRLLHQTPSIRSTTNPWRKTVGSCSSSCSSVRLKAYDEMRMPLCYYDCRRSYIFLPSTFSEWMQSIRSMIVSTTEEEGEEERQQQQQQEGSNPRTTIRVRWLRKKKEQIRKGKKLYQENKELYQQLYQQQKLRMKEKKLLMKEKWKHTLQKNYKQEVMYYTQTFRIPTEKQPEWFDETTGYPLTAVDPNTQRFVNPWNNTPLTNGQIFTLTQFLSWQFQRFFFNKDHSSFPQPPSTMTMTAPPSLVQPEQQNTSDSSSSDDRVVVRWLGHSTCLVEMHGILIMTDPHLSDYAATIPRSPNTQVISCVDKDLPDCIPIVVLSHDHYDHLDIPTLQRLKHKVQYLVVPKGHASYLQHQLHNNDDPNDADAASPTTTNPTIIELEWWQSATFTTTTKDSHKHKLQFVSSNHSLQDLPLMFTPTSSSKTNSHVNNEKTRVDVVVTCTPAQHYCSRTPFDRNRRLWCSYSICSFQVPSQKQLKFFFAGDTGYPKEFPLFRQIGDLLGPFHMAAIPIGAYQPTNLFESSHVNPQQAVQIHSDIQAEKSLAIHWGTFDLADEHLQEPPTLLHSLTSKNHEIDFTTIPHGHSIVSNPNTATPNTILPSDITQEEDDEYYEEVVVDDEEEEEEEESVYSSSS